MTFSAASKRYNWRVVCLSLLYVAFLSRRFTPSTISSFTARSLMAPQSCPRFRIFGAMGRYLVEEQDEYVRMLTVRQTLWATGFALSVATVWGFLESFNLVGHIDAYYVAVLWFGGLGLGACINRATLGAVAGC